MADERWRDLLAEAWRAVSGAAESGAARSGAAHLPVALIVDGRVPVDRLPSTLPVADVAVACVGAALLAAGELGGARSVGLSAAHLAAAVRSEAYLRIDGQPAGAGFAPLSRFWRAADGWVRTHGNYPWHRDALLRAVGRAGSGAVEPGAVAGAIAAMPAEVVEQRVVEAGGVAAALRTPEQWLAHPAGRAVAGQPLVATTALPGAPPRRRPTRSGSRPLGGVRVLEGVRVLDLTRVIAGPVCTRFLAALGAEVLRLDPPDRPELRLHRYDGLPGKRSALLDAASAGGLDRLHELLDGADVLVHGYRPGALARFGLDAGSLADRHPGLVVVSLSAWGGRGPWGDRRGFDSIVQVATGIADRESAAPGSMLSPMSAPGSAPAYRPGALPCQLLDHGTGYLCAAAALHGLRRQTEEGGTWLSELSLARTALWLLAQPAVERPGAAGLVDDSDWLTTLPSHAGPVTTVDPPGTVDGQALRWPALPVDYGAAEPSWVPRPENPGVS
ncbi:MAG TPA: CoA transferase [Pseudonocardia sp.]